MACDAGGVALCEHRSEAHWHSTGFGHGASKVSHPGGLVRVLSAREASTGPSASVSNSRNTSSDMMLLRRSTSERQRSQ